MDAEVVWLDERGVPNFDTLHSCAADHLASMATICGISHFVSAS
jgi:hypothetical protein